MYIAITVDVCFALLRLRDVAFESSDVGLTLFPVGCLGVYSDLGLKQKSGYIRVVIL